MTYRTPLILGSAFGALGVILGATGVHQLKEFLNQAGRTDTFELAVRYQFYHALALLIVGVLQRQLELSFKWAALSFTGGIVLFSGSLYVLCFTGVKTLGAITPIGGLLFIAGWILVILGALKGKTT